MPIPVHVDPAPVRELAAPLAAVQPNATLQVTVDGASCTFAQLDVQGRARLLDASLAEWLVEAGWKASVSIVPAPPCDGLPPVQSLAVPSSGWLIGLLLPARAVNAAGELSVVPIGEDARWWLVAGSDTAQLAASHDGAPPTRFELAFGEGQAADTVEVPLGGAVVLPTPLSGTATDVVSTAIAAVRLEGRSVVAIGRASGTVAGAVRDGDQPPVPFLLRVGAPLSASAVDVAVRAGGSKRLKLDAPAASSWTADERVATVEMSGVRLVVAGRAPGRTHLVVRSGDEVFLVPLVVGE